MAELQPQQQPSAVLTSTKPTDGLTSAAGGASPPASRAPAPPSHRPSWEAAQAERQLERLQTSLEDSELQISKLVSRLKHALYDKAAALERLRKAYATRIEAKPLDAAAVMRASSIAGAAVLPARMHAKEELLPMYVPVGVVCATPLSHSLAETAGFGCDGRDHDVLVVQQHGLAGRPSAFAGRTAAEDGAIASAVAVRQGRGGLGLGIHIHTGFGLSPGMLERLDDTWLLKLVFDPPGNCTLDADVELPMSRLRSDMTIAPPQAPPRWCRPSSAATPAVSGTYSSEAQGPKESEPRRSLSLVPHPVRVPR